MAIAITITHQALMRLLRFSMHGVRAGRRGSPLEHEADDGGDDQDAGDAGEQDQESAAVAVMIALPASVRAPSRAARARSRNADLSSPPQARSGAPNVTVHRSGIGTNSPFGMTRLRFSIHTGTSSTCGRASQDG